MLVVGDSGAGKTTVAAKLAERCGIPHVELDALFHEGGWTEAAPQVFRTRVAEAAAGDAWVVDGNYSGRVRDVLWPRATTIVWLDLPLRVTIPRIVSRTAVRLLRRQKLFNGNRERLVHVLHADHPIWWTLRRHRGRRRSYVEALDDRWVRLGSREQVRSWLRAADRRTL